MTTSVLDFIILPTYVKIVHLFNRVELLLIFLLQYQYLKTASWKNE